MPNLYFLRNFYAFAKIEFRDGMLDYPVFVHEFVTLSHSLCYTVGDFFEITRIFLAFFLSLEIMCTWLVSRYSLSLLKRNY